MKTISLTEAKAQLSKLIRRVERGEVVLITSHGRLVARLTPPLPSEGGPQEERLAELERLGIVVRGRRPPSLDFLKLPIPKEKPDVLGALLEDREESR